MCVYVCVCVCLLDMTMPCDVSPEERQMQLRGPIYIEQAGHLSIKYILEAIEVGRSFSQRKMPRLVFRL